VWKRLNHTDKEGYSYCRWVCMF